MCIVNECLKDKNGMKFSYHVPTMYEYRKRMYSKETKNETKLLSPHNMYIVNECLKDKTGMK